MKRNIFAMLFVFAIGLDGLAIEDAPKQGDARRVELGKGVTLEVLYIPPGEFMMGSTPEEKKWATGIEGGAQAAEEGAQGEEEEGGVREWGDQR